MEPRKIAVIGAGTMGSGIAQIAAQSGYEVIMKDIEDEYAKTGFMKIKERLDRRVSEKKLEMGGKEQILSRIKASARFEDCKGVDLIIEAVVENEETKKDVYRELNPLCSEEVIFATNTSCLSITRLAQASGRPDRFVGMHFMNPAYSMKLVEIIRGLRTSEETTDIIRAVAAKMGKVTVAVNDSPGFVISRVIAMMINDAIYCLEEGVAPKEGIDTIMKFGANHPMGPLELADLMGLDICLEILEVLHNELGEKYRPCPLLRKMVAAGKLGRKSKEGFYRYK